MEEHSQRERLLGGSIAYVLDQAELGHVRREEKGKGERREGNLVQQPGGSKVQRKQVTKMVGLYRKSNPPLWAGEVHIRGWGMVARRTL